jgi:dihydroneopterin aldolase
MVMTEIVLTDVVNGTLTETDGIHSWTGTGIFDVLMDAVNKNLDAQYRNQRLNGADYAMVYSNAITTVLQQAIDFALREQLVEAQVEQTDAQTALLFTQRVKVDKETALLGLDEVLKTVNLAPEAVYTPKYEQ